MRSLRIIVFVVVVIVAAGCATSKPRQFRTPVNIPAQVTSEFQAAVAAWNVGNLNNFLGIYADDATFALADDYLQGRDSIREFYAPNFQPGAVQDQLSMERFDVQVLDPETVLVRGIYRNSRGAEVTRRGTTTLIMRNMGGTWRIVHDHTN